jgi:hypothetical protein
MIREIICCFGISLSAIYGLIGIVGVIAGLIEDNEEVEGFGALFTFTAFILGMLTYYAFGGGV